LPLGGIEVDELNGWAPGEARDPPVHVVAGERELLALNELHDSAALEVD
jgi:hypothetical protein